MAIIFGLLLLAACSTHVVGGPVPRNHQRSQFTGYFNTTSTVSSVSEQRTVQADTAIVVEPIQETVFTSIAPAITFVNPNGDPVVTQDPQTIFSTSFITPTPKPTSDKVSSALPTPVSTPDPRQAPTGTNALPTPPSDASSALSSTVKAVENTTASGTSRQIPKFTYSPAEKATSTSVASPTDVASEAPVPTSGGMPGFQHPGSAGPGLRPSNNSSSPTVVASSAVPSVNPSGSPIVSSSRSRIVVTSYTTVYASAPLPDAATTVSGTPGSVKPTQTQQPSSSSQSSSELTKQPTCSEGQEAAPSVTSSIAQALPSASLQVPPVVIITSFTTVMASLESSTVPQAPATSVVPEPVVPSSSVVSSASETTSSLAVPTPSTNPTSSPSPSLPESSTLVKPTSSLAPPPEPPAQQSSSTTPPPLTSATPTPSSIPTSSQTPTSTPNLNPSPSAPTNVSSASSSSSPSPSPSSSPEPTPSSSSISSSSTTSEGPLIITPIPPSQVFTVTETATKTEKETVKETVTVTAA